MADERPGPPDLAGVLITGVGDLFIPDGDMSGQDVDGWAELRRPVRL